MYLPLEPVYAPGLHPSHWPCH